MTTKRAADLAIFEKKVGDAARLLKLVANEKRLLILCRLIGEKEMPVGALADAVGLSQSALSQHLAMMRDNGLVGTRRDAQTIFYSLADPKVARLLQLLKDIYCP